MFLKSKNPKIKVVLADSQVILYHVHVQYACNSCIHTPVFQIQEGGGGVRAMCCRLWGRMGGGGALPTPIPPLCDA